MTLPTKWQVLSERVESLLEQAREITADMDRLNTQYFGANCTGCEEWLKTEGDFARHFVIPNIAYLNLGECPRKRDVDDATRTVEASRN